MYFIFDFDGTLVNSFLSSIEIFNQLAENYNFKKIGTEACDIPIEQIKDLSSKQLMKQLNVRLYRLPSVIFQARKLMNKKMFSLEPVPGIEDTLSKLHRMGCSLGIATSNSEENVRTWLECHHIQHLFSFIHSESSFFQKHQILKKLLKIYKIHKAETFYVGDETRDIDAAKQNAISSIATTWGFNSEKILMQCQPDYIAHQPQDLLKIYTKAKETINNQEFELV